MTTDTYHPDQPAEATEHQEQPNAGPTDAEVEAAAQIIWYWYVGGSFGFGKPAYAYDTEKARDAARAALIAARKA